MRHLLPVLRGFFSNDKKAQFGLRYLLKCRCFGFGVTKHGASDLRGGESVASEPVTSCFSQPMCEYLCVGTSSTEEPWSLVAKVLNYK